jgi:hypothetical protein
MRGRFDMGLKFIYIPSFKPVNPALVNYTHGLLLFNDP